jgi:hypothetical protein
MSETSWLTNTRPESMINTIFASWGVQASRGESYNPERLRLFACACVRRVWDLLDDDHRLAVTLLEQHARAPVAGGVVRARQAYRAASKQLAQQWKRQWRTHWSDSNVIGSFSKGKLPWSEGPSRVEPDPGAGLEITARCFAAGAVWKAADNKASTAALACGNANRAAAYRQAAAQVRQSGGPALRLSRGHLFYSVEEAVAQCVLMRDIFGNPFRPAALDRSWLTATVASLAQAAAERLSTGDLDPARLGVLADALEEAGCAARDVLDHLRASGPHVLGCWPVDLLLEAV